MRSLLALSLVGPTFFLATNTGASSVSPVQVITSPGLATSYQLPVTIGGEPVDPAYSCIGLSPVSCTSQVSYGYPGVAEITTSNKVIFAPNTAFLGITSPLIWQVQTDSGQVQTGEIQFGVAKTPSITALLLHPEGTFALAAFYYQLQSPGFPLNSSEVALCATKSISGCGESLTVPKVGRFLIVARSGLVSLAPVKTAIRKASPLGYLRLSEPWGPSVWLALELSN